MTWKSVLYSGQVDFSKFVCDSVELNDYLQKKAVNEHTKDICTLYFLTNTSNEVGGFFTLNSGSINRDEFLTAKERQNLGYYSLGTIHIGRLARHKDIIKQQLGSLLVMEAIAIAVDKSRYVAAHAITVDAKDARVEKLYTDNSFKHFKSAHSSTIFPKRLYMKMSEARFILSK